MSQVHLVIVVLESDFETQRIVRASTLTLHLVLVVADIVTGSVPANATRLSCILHRVKERLLALIVRTIWLDEINYVEFVADILANVCDFKVVPLSVCCRAIVIFQNQVVSC